jgi:hypothetical protein
MLVALQCTTFIRLMDTLAGRDTSANRILKEAVQLWQQSCFNYEHL